MALEKTTEAWLKKKLEGLGGLFLKWTSPGCVGVPDRILVIGGRIMFVELKQETGRLSEAQKHMLAELARRGAACHVVYGKAGAELFFASLSLMLTRGGDPFIAYGYKISKWHKKPEADTSKAQLSTAGNKEVR